MYNDTGLTPNTYYSYYLESFNVIDSTRSSEVVFKTLEGIPTGLDAPTYTVLNSTAVRVMWVEPMVAHGTISHYILLIATQSEDSEFEEVFRGNMFEHTVTNLRPYTNYTFIIEACTNGGCGASLSSQVQTAEAAPTSQPPPNVATLSDTQLSLTWEAPAEPNGVILGYRIFQREAPFEDDGVQIMNVDAATQSLAVNDLEPFTRYQFRVESYTKEGGTSSEWTEGRTGEAAPTGVDPPGVSAVSSTSLEVTWTEPATANGVITNYSLFSITSGGDAESFLTSSPSPSSFIVTGLEPFTEYSFVVEVCTAAGCTRSNMGKGFTGESGK
jgi:usherin